MKDFIFDEEELRKTFDKDRHKLNGMSFKEYKRAMRDLMRQLLKNVFKETQEESNND